MWSIRVLSGPQTGQIFDLKMGKNTFGRGLNCDFKISSVGISKEHCEVHVYKDKVIVLDLKSSNGTFVNGIKIQNSIVKLGDKISLFDVIMDVIPTPDIRPRPSSSTSNSVSTPSLPSERPKKQMRPQPAAMPQHQQMMSYPANGSGALQMQGAPLHSAQATVGVAPLQAAEPQLTLAEKYENYVENVVMPVFYKLSVVMPFKQVLMGMVVLFVLIVTLASIFPLTTIIKESNFNEAAKRAKSVARSMARINEQALLSGQLGNLSVSEALKEDGIKEAFIIQHSDGAIIAPTEKAGRESSKPFILQARKESRASAAQIDGNMIGASHPIAAYDPISGETAVRYHAVVYYDISSLNVKDERIISLFMQTLLIGVLLGLGLYVLFARMIEHPLKQLNKQIDTALREKSDRTEVLFDYPEMQKVVANVNLLLNRMWNGLSDNESMKPQQNRDIEFTNTVEMLTQPAVVINQTGVVVALNSQFEQLVQMPKDSLIQQSYKTIVDPALVQNIEGLIARSTQSVYERQQDRIPFSQFDCDIYTQAFLDAAGAPEYFFVSLTKVS